MDWKGRGAVPRVHPRSNRRWRIGRAGVALVAASLAGLAVPWAFPQSSSPPEAEPGQPIPVEQPLPYSHKTHVALGLQCRDCHAIADPGYLAGYPAEATCMACHSAIKADSPHIEQLARYSAEGSPVPWKRVYRVPDYVWFSHASHVVDASVECETCHGPVAQREVLFQEKPTTMAACMKCHAQYNAPNDCDLCHDPG